MALQDYILNWSNDSLKAPINIPQLSKNTTDTSLTLFGQGAELYGEGFQENMLRLLENFASDVAPAQPTSGQLWYDTSVNQLKIYDGATFTVQGITATKPTNPTAGQLWYDTANTTMNVYDGATWKPLMIDSNTVIVASAALLPTSPNLGEVFFLVGDGVYVYDGAAWVRLFSANDSVVTSVNGLTGDISGIATTGNVVTSVNGLSGQIDNVVKLDEVQTVSNKRISAYYYLDKLTRLAAATGAIALDISTSSVFYLELSGNTTLSLLNAPVLNDEEHTFVINIRQGATARSVTWFPSIMWLTTAGTPPSLPGANQATEYIFTRSPAGMYGRKGASTA